MLTKFLSFLGCYLFLLTAHAQIYIDPAVAAATSVHAGVMNSQLNDVNSNLTLIQRGQLAVTGQLLIVNDLQDKIYKGLSEVSGVVRSLLTVKDIAGISLDIVNDVEKAMNIASGNPALLLFAEAGAREFKTRATNLATEVSAFVLKGGKDNLMDSGERAKLLNRIRTELTILRGVAYGMHRSMYWAKQRGILNSLNPYAGFINIDKQIADDIIRNSRLLKR
ncbi:hypothetical protein [Sphingobacterium thalpophilum]|uniref:hypothetical protein n=1 Tax=Sphingobacterium thalpophilum TaxID=259 RepID=UPI002D78A1B2|nr:hypothetical protein [Sphingobacterium thalpophilum]